MAGPWDKFAAEQQPAAEPTADGPWAKFKGSEAAPVVAPKDGPSPIAQGLSWANQAIAGVPDALLNTPTNLLNLGKAAIGAPMVAMGRPDLAPQPSPTPDIVGGLFEKFGLTNRNLDPTSTEGRIAKSALQAGVTGLIAPAQSARQLASNVGQAATSGLVGQGTAEATDSPELGMAAAIATPAAMTARANAQRNAATANQTRNSVRDETLTDARREGYVVPPSAVNPGIVTNRLESVAGRPAMAQDAALRNQEVTNRLARRSIGLQENTPITERALDARRTVLSEPYRQIAGLSQSAANDLAALRQARSDAQAQWRFYDRSADPQAQAQARTLDRQADTLEMRLVSHARAAGRPELVPELTRARTAIARTYDVERALNVGDGNVSARMIGRALDRGRPLTGELATIGRFSEAFPQFSREAAGVPTPNVSQQQGLASAALALGGFGTMGPLGTALGLVPLASGPIRGALLSNAGQNALVAPRQNNSPVLSDTYLRSLLSGASQANQ